MRAWILILGLGVASGAAYAQEPLFDCGVQPETPVTVVPKHLPPGMAPPQFTRSAVALPPLLWLSSDRSFLEVGLLYWRIDDAEARSRFRLALPLLLDDCTPHVRTFLLPIYGWRRDPDGVAGYFLNYYYRRDARRDANVLFPLYWRVRTFRDDGTVLTSALGIPPLMLRTENDGLVTWISPLGYLRSGRDRFAAALWPLYFGGADADGGYLIVPPLATVWWHDRDSSTSVVGPAYYHSHPSGWDAGVVPLALLGRHRDSSYTIVPPLLALDVRDAQSHLTLVPPLVLLHAGDGESETTVVGPGYYHTHADGWDAGLLPLALVGRHRDSSYTIVPPLLALDVRDAQSHLTLLPPLLLMHEGNGESETTVVGPGYYHTHADGWDAGLLPLALVGRHRDSSYTLLPPLLTLDVRDAESALTLAGPAFYWRDKGGWDAGLVPAAFLGRHGDSAYTVLPSLGFVDVRDAESQTTVVGPAFYHAHEDGWDAGLVPAAFVGRHRGSAYTLVPPLGFMDLRDAEGSFTMAALLWLHGQKPDGQHFTLVPPLALLHLGDGHTETTLVGPAYDHRHEGGWDAGIAPLAFVGRHPGSAYTLVPPLVLAAHEGPRHFTVIPPLLFARAGDGEHELLLAGPFYGWSNADAEHEGFLPLWLHGRWRDGDHYTIVPPALLVHAGGAASETTVVGPAYHHRDADGWDAGIVPALFVGRHRDSAYTLLPPVLLSAREGARHFTLVPPLLYAHAGDGASELTLAGPYYSFADGTGEHTGLLPLWLHGRWQDGDHYTIVPPALLVHAGGAESETTVLGPAYHHAHAAGWDAGLFPAVFVGRHVDSSYTLVPPLALDWRRGAEYATVVPPLVFAHFGDWLHETTIAGPYYSHHDPLGEHLGIVGLYHTGRATDGRHYTLVPPALLLHLGDGQSETTIAGPGFYHSDADGWDAGLAPLAFVGRHRQSAYTLIAPPLVMDFRDALGSFTMAGPFALHGAHANGDHYTIVPPLLLVHAGSIESETTVVGPGYYHSSASGWDAGLAPAALLGRHGSSRYALVAPPLFMDFRSPDHSTTLAGPVYVHREPDKTQVAVLPLACYRGTPDTTRLTIFPLVHYSATRESSTLLAPLFYHDAEPGSSRTMVFPFFWDAHDAAGSSRVVFPFYWDFASHEGDSRFTLAPPLWVRYRKADTETNIVGPVAWSIGPHSWSFHLFPAFAVESARPDHLKWRALYGLVGRERSGAWHRWQVFYAWTDPTT